MLPADLPNAASCGIDLGRKFDLGLKTFSGTYDVRAGVSPVCGFELLNGALDEATSELLACIYNAFAPHIVERAAAARNRGATVRIIAEGHEGPSFDIAAGVDVDLAQVHPPDWA